MSDEKDLLLLCFALLLSPSWAGLFSGCGDDLGGKLVINELAAAGVPDDWFEVFNGTGEDIDLANYSFTDDLADRPQRSRFPEGLRVAAGDYAVVTLNEVFPGFKLGGDEELGIYDPEGQLIDSVDWDEGQSPLQGSFGRMPDGTGAFRTLYTATPGAANRVN